VEVAAGLGVAAGFASGLLADAVLAPAAAGLGAPCVLAGVTGTLRFGAAVSAAFAANIRTAVDAAQHSNFLMNEPSFY
jgi:hypothetical protein